MKFFFALVVLFACAAGLAGLHLEGLHNLETREGRLFAEFLTKYNVHYEPKDLPKRFEIFKSNLKEIDRKNKLNTGAVHNITKFSAMTKDEFRKYPCGVNKLSDLNSLRPNFKPVIAQPDAKVLSVAPPASFDWTQNGAVTPVKDQAQCGSCWAFSTIGNIEGVWFLAGNKLVGLSEEEIVSCSTTDYGCQGGWPFWALTDMLKSPYSGQIDTESGYPYTSGNGVNGNCLFKQGENKGATIKSYKSYCTEQTAACEETLMQQLLVTYGPLSVCLDAGPMQTYTGGVDNPPDCDPNAIDHCVTLVGYGTDNGVDFWKIKNSWNTNWGEQGYYRLIRGTGACGINKVITISSV